jgi:hypothetical protein
MPEGDRRVRDRMVVGFVTAYEISAHHPNVVSSNSAQARSARYIFML